MVWKTSYNAGLGQPVVSLAGVHAFPRVAVGTIIKGYDDLMGEGEFIYLPGVAGLTAGDHVVYDLMPGAPTVTRSSTANANAAQQSAVAVIAIPAGSYGWYQISGVAIVNVVPGSVAGRAFLSATAGQLSSTQANGSGILSARLSSAAGTPVGGQAYITMSRPFVQGQTA